MPTKVKINRLEHNIGKGQRPDTALSVPTHKERMVKRKAVRALRTSEVVYRPGSRIVSRDSNNRRVYTGPFVSVSKYNPTKELKKQIEKRKEQAVGQGL